MPSTGTNLRFGKNLPKVTEYVKNLGKSVAYSTTDYFSGTMENTSDFIETNQELFKDIYHAAREYRNTMRAVDKSIRSSKVYEAGQALKKSLFDSIRTGKFYDAERQSEYELKASGELGNMGDMGDWGGNDEFDIKMEDENFDQSETGKSTSIVTATIQDATVSQANIIAKSTEYLAETNKASTALLFAQGERMYASVNSGMASIQSMLSRVNNFMEGPMTTHMENSTKFYQEITGKMNEVTAMMKESLEMQRNLYKKEQKSGDESQWSMVGVTPNLKEYGKQIKKNFMEFLGPEAQMLLGNDMGEGSNMLLAMVANPLKFIPDFLVRAIVPATIKRSLESLDKSFAGLFANMIARFNKWAKDDSGAPEFLRAIGKLFGLKMDNKTSIDTGKYEKGPVPFDGVTKKAITEVIPGYLARIEAALSSSTERVFDFERGKWMSISDIEKEYKNRKSRTYRDGAYDVSDDLRREIEELKKHNAEAAKRMQENADKLFKKIYEDYGAFDPYRTHGFGDDKEDPWDYYDMDKEEFLHLANLIVGSTGGKGKKGYRKSGAMKLAASMQESRESFARWLKDAENNQSAMRHLFSGAYNFDMGSDSQTMSGNKASKGTKYHNIIADSVDRYNKNIFYYLRGMYVELIAMRNAGYGSGGKKKGRGPKGPRSPVGDPLKDLEKTLGAEIDAEAAAVAANAASGAANEEGFNEDSWRESWDQAEAARRREAEEANKKKGWFASHFGSARPDSDKGFLTQLLEAGSLGAKFKVITANINSLMDKPGLALAGIIDTADKRLFQLVFGSKEGQEYTDKNGRSFRGFMDYLISRTRETFDKMNDWIDENILDPIKKKLGVDSLADLFKLVFDKLGWTDKFDKVKAIAKQYTRPVVDRLKAKGKTAWNTFTGAMSATYGQVGRVISTNMPIPPAAQAVSTGAYTPQPTNIDQSEDATDYDAILEWNAAPQAHGGLITRRGLAIISPGERVVPIGGKVTQRNNLAAERAFARRYGIRGAEFYAAGTADAANQPIQKDERDVVERTIKQVMNEVVTNKENKGVANVIASGLIGGGVSLITGMVGGPLLGAAVGSAFGIAQNSETVQKWLFGEEVVNEKGEKERKGGVITKEMQEKFKKYFPSIKNFGIAGAVAGLFTPFGIVGGMLAGSAIGFVKETDTFKDFVFGKANEKGDRDGGLIKKEFRDKVKKAAPAMIAGAIGGALLGPFGIVGNAILGSALGFVTTTDKFKDVVFGKKDEKDGKRKGGLVGALYRGMVKPFVKLGKEVGEKTMDFLNKKVFKPLENFGTAFTQMIKNGITSIGDSVKDHLQKMFEKTIGRPLHDFLEHSIFDKVRKWMGRILKAPLALAKGIVSAPFSMLNAIGNNIRTSQIAKGTAGDMTAQQRLDWREKHRFRMFGKELTGHDSFRGLDEKLANMKGTAGVEKMEQLREQMKLYLDTKGEVGRQVAELVKKAGEITSDTFNNARTVTDDTVSVYTAVGARTMKKIFVATSKGDLDTIESLCSKFVKTGLMSAEDAANYLNKIAPYVQQIADGIERKKNSAKYQRDLQASLSALTGGALKDTKTIRRFNRLLGSEIDARKAELAKDAAEGGDAAEESIPDIIDKSTDKIIKVLEDINENLRINRMPPKERQKYLRSKGGKAGGGSGKAEEGATAVDDLIIGTQRQAADLVSKSYHTVEANGAQAIMDDKGRFISSGGASIVRKAMQEDAKEKKDSRSWREKLNDGLFGKFVSGITKGVGGAKSGLFGALGWLVNKVAPVLNILKWVFIGGTAIAAAGHASGLVKDILWPFIRDKVGPWFIGNRNEDGVLQGGLRGIIFGDKNVESGQYEGGLISGLTNKFAAWFETTPVYSVMHQVKEIYDTQGLVGFVQPIIDWYSSGFEAFAKNIVTPMVSTFVQYLPELAMQIAEGVINGISKWSIFGGDKKTGDVSVDSEGNAKISYNLTGASAYNNTDLKTTSVQSQQNLVGKELGLTNQATNTFIQDENGNYLFKNDDTGEVASRQEDANGNVSYVYSDGRVADPSEQFTMLKENEYSKYGSSNNIFGTLLSGAGNNLLAGLAGYNLGPVVTKLPTFGAKGILKNVRKLFTKGPIGKMTNLAALTGKTVWNTTATVGSTSRGIGNAIRTEGGDALSNWVKRVFNVDGAGDAAKAAEASKKSGGVVSKLKNFIFGSSDDAAEAGTKSGGIASKLKNLIFGSADDAAGAAASSADDVAKSGGLITKLATKTKDLISGAVQKVSESSPKAATAIEKVASTATKAADNVSGFLPKIKEGILKFFTGIAENKVVKGLLSGAAKIFGTSIDDVLITTGFKEAGELLAKKVGENIVSNVAKSLVNALAVIPIATIALAVTYFISGWNDAHNVFGIAKDIDIPISYNLISGLVNAVKNSLPGAGIILGFIPTSFIIELFTDKILPFFGWDNSNLKKMQEESEKIMDKYNASVGVDQQVTSIEDYNEATHPGLVTKIKQTANIVGGKVVSGVKSAASFAVNNAVKAGQAIKNWFGFSREAPDAGHLYQNAVGIAGKKFGNSTIGEAGCGPVAATNLINRLSGMGPGMDLDSASRFALNYTDSTGGTQMNYFTDILNANGYRAAETSSKSALLKSISRGNPAVLLGNSGREAGTPFGANNHYINAMGLDKTGKNMIVEDPDLPQSTKKYPVKDVMKDTISGVATFGGAGLGRKISDYYKIRKNGKRYASGKAQTTTMEVSSIAMRAIPIIYAGESGGNYDAINANDNGAMSIGLIQWRASRARGVLLGIVNALGETEARRIAGDTLYNNIVNESDTFWSTYHTYKNSNLYNKIKALLQTSVSQDVQKAQVIIDMNSYVSSIKSLGVKDENAIIFMCHLMNAYGSVKSEFLNRAKSKAGGSVSNITLDNIYDACMEDDYYYNHYGENNYAKKVYNAIVNSEPVGDTTTKVDIANVDLNTQANAKAVNAASEVDSTSTDGSITEILSQLGSSLFKKIYGDDVAQLLGVSADSIAGNDSSKSGRTINELSSIGGSSSGYMVNLPSNASAAQKQQALVDIMKTIQGKIRYTTSGAQDPDQGTASCASTVAWAYRKVLGYNPGGSSGYASSTEQSKDANFTDIYINGGNGYVSPSVLQKGDIMYFNWDRTSNNNDMDHTEMYAGNLQDWNHGGNPEYGPVLRDLNDYRLKHLMKVRRYNDFIAGSGRSRRRIDRRNIGYARVDNSTIQRANSTIQRYGIDSKLLNQQSNQELIYAQYFSAMITLLSVIADNTEALSALQSALANRGANISTEDLQRAAGNARKRAAKARQAQNNIRQNSSGFVDFGDATDMQNILNGPTGYIVQTMETLAKE